jgi:hypothetical protein
VVTIPFVALRSPLSDAMESWLDTFRFVDVAFVVVPLIESNELIVDDADEMKPPVNVESPVTPRVDERVAAPAMLAVPVAVRFARERLPEIRPLPWTERNCVGVDVPNPRKPVDVNVLVAVPPKNACVAESCVVEALPLNCRRVVVALPGKRYAKVA